MRKTFVVATVIVSLFTFAPSQARTKTVTKKHIMFNAPLACAVACAHNVDDLTSDVASTDAAQEHGVTNPTGATISTCADPFPIAGYADFVVKAPKGANTLVFTIRPQGDWDSYICSYPTKGKSKVLASGANSASADCILTCVETTMIKVKPGTRYLLRAYNWADAVACPGEYRFLTVT